MIRVVFFGTSEESTHALNALIGDARFEVIAVVTKPPRATGRNHAVESSAVDRIAQERRIEVLVPEKPIEVLNRLREIGADVFVVASYGRMLPKEIVDLPSHGSINVHPSLLPHWRGATPVPATIKAGDTISGVTIIVMDEKMDHGPIVDQVEAPVPPNVTTATYLHELMRLGASRLPDVLVGLVAGKITPIEQDHNQATFCKLLSRDDGRMDWSRPTEELERMVRAYDPWPGTWTEADDDGVWKRLKILEAHVDNNPAWTPLGSLQTDGALTRVGQLVIDRLQFESKKPVTGTGLAATSNGRRWKLR